MTGEGLKSGQFGAATADTAPGRYDGTGDAPAAPKKGLRAAIDAHCRWCCHDPASGLGNWRQQTGACQITSCALWPVRPVSRGGDRD